MRHTSGLTYGFTGVSPVQKLVKAADVMSSNRTAAENVEAIATLPLMHQPGEVWEYSASTDVLGRILEIVEGAPLGEVLQERLLGPLGMTDTAFFTPQSKLARRAEPFSFDFMTAAGVDAREFDGAAEIRIRRRRPHVDARRLHAFRRHAEPRRRARGRAHDRAANARLHGERPSRRQDRQKPLPALARPWLRPRLFGAHRPGKAPTAGSVGEFFWGGMMGTAFWVSPRDSLSPSSWFRRPKIASIFACCSATWSPPRSHETIAEPRPRRALSRRPE